MNIKYEAELLTGFYNNHTALAENELYEKSHKNSIFKSLLKIEKEYFKNEKFSTVIAYDNDIPIGFILFEHYEKLDSGKFTYNKVKRHFLTFGSLQMYIKPEYRKQGLASEMSKILEAKLKIYVLKNYDIIDQFAIINAVDGAYRVLSRVFDTFVPSYTGRNNNKNKSDLISALRFHSKYKSITNS
jgi:GNAT superfamily N-acetyltransferase